MLVLKDTGEVRNKFNKTVHMRKEWTTEWTDDTHALAGGGDCGRKRAGPEFSELLLSPKSLHPFCGLYTLHRLTTGVFHPTSNTERQEDPGKEETATLSGLQFEKSNDRDF